MTKYAHIEWDHHPESGWSASLSGVSARVHHIPGNRDRLFLTSGTLIASLFENYDLMTFGEDDYSIEVAKEEALALVHGAIVRRLADLEREQARCRSALDRLSNASRPGRQP
jgi:hypothetical protein